MRIPVALALLVPVVAAAIAQPPAPNPKAPKCTKPVARKEWRDLTKKEKKAFIDAVKCLSTIPGSKDFYAMGWNVGIVSVLPRNKRSFYDDFVYSHMDTNERTHFVGGFLYWHRMFLRAFENALREQCGYQGGLPYWAWNMDIADMQHSPVFDPDPVYGLGTWGTAESEWAVTDGAFKDMLRPYPYPHVIKRAYQPQPFIYGGIYPFEFDQPYMYQNETATPDKINALIKGFKGDPYGFQVALEGHRCQGIHSAIHFQFGTKDGGDVANNSHAPNDVFFFLLHNNIDRIWQKWKDYDPANTYAIAGGTVKRLDLFLTDPQGLGPEVQLTDPISTSGLHPNVTIGDFITTKQGYACYYFEDPKDEKL